MEKLEATRSAPTAVNLQRQHSLATQVRREIERMIEAGELVSGDWINEALIASQLNVSRGTVREGCRSLQETGLVHVIVNRGAFVREVDAKEAAELYDLRAALFALAGRTLAGKITKTQITALTKMVSKMDKLAGTGDTEGYYRENRLFHDSLLEYAGNARLTEQYQSYARELQLFLRKALMKPGRMAESNEEHRQIVELLASRDAAGAASLMEQVVLNVKARLFGDS
ncbi:GntR family transcriptional regulator [Caballeronia sp. LZ065]|uniref:GntR family transcriptional regulator n=1 Tax=Caballeronia sp. LZ065 TaxID=3038571 RepID=UPI002867657E|nr:GntR family transcriptional regulator [Caballeronia sp. LZ065]MDR5781261.1 GntR family transcriptional regulator [Caballeronia sp. LZ065]